MTSALSPALQTEVANPSLVWVNAVEPLADIGRVSGSLQAVALSADGTTIVDRVLSSNGGLQSARDMGLLGSPIGADPPSPRRGFQAVLSRAAGGLFVLGGQDASTGAALHDAWVQLVGQGWRQIVLAAGPSLRGDPRGHLLLRRPPPLGPRPRHRRLPRGGASPPSYRPVCLIWRDHRDGSHVGAAPVRQLLARRRSRREASYSASGFQEARVAPLESTSRVFLVLCWSTPSPGTGASPDRGLFGLLVRSQRTRRRAARSQGEAPLGILLRPRGVWERRRRRQGRWRARLPVAGHGREILNRAPHRWSRAGAPVGHRRSAAWVRVLRTPHGSGRRRRIDARRICAGRAHRRRGCAARRAGRLGAVQRLRSVMRLLRSDLDGRPAAAHSVAAVRPELRAAPRDRLPADGCDLDASHRRLPARNRVSSRVVHIEWGVHDGHRARRGTVHVLASRGS